MREEWRLIRDVLPDYVKVKFDDIVEQRVLGASRHISMIGEMIEAIALEGRKENRETEKVIEDIKKVTAFFMATRGEASQAINNAILLMIHGIDGYASCTVDEAVGKILETKDRYLSTSDKAIEKVVEYAAELAKGMKRIFVYDYSSTVEKFLTRLQHSGNRHTVYIAESRVIDGGVPFVMACQKAGHRIKFIPDAAIMYYLKDCEGVFMGAETFYPDGTGFNTTGSDLVGLVCAHYGIPLYFLTPLIKLDIRPVYGYKRKLVMSDLERKLTCNWSNEIEAGKIDFESPELVPVEAKYINGYVTEKGIIPANQMYHISLAYSRYLRGDENEYV